MENLHRKTWTPLAASAPRASLDPEVRPRLTPHVRVRQDDGGVREIDLAWETAWLEPDDGRRVGELLSYADGTRSLNEIARRCGWHLAETLDIVQDLYELGALEDAAGRPVPALSFHDHMVAVGRALRWQMVERVGVLEPASGGLTRRLLLGFLVETWHYVASVATHLSPAIVNAPNERLQMMFSEYLSEEFWHGRLLREGLLKAGLTTQELDLAHPLPGMMGQITFMRWAAQTNLLGYATLIGIAENPAGHEGLLAARTESWHRIGALELLPDEVLAPFREHELLDTEADHGALSAEVFAEVGPLTKPQQDDIRRIALGFLHISEESYRGIQRYYGVGDGPPVFMLK